MTYQILDDNDVKAVLFETPKKSEAKVKLAEFIKLGYSAYIVMKFTNRRVA